MMNTLYKSLTIAILEVIDRNEEHAPDTAAGLRELVGNYQMVE